MENALEDNAFCTAILQILNKPDIHIGAPTFDSNDPKYEFEKNGEQDETFHIHDDSQHGLIDRKPLAVMQPKIEKNLPKKAEKAKLQKSGFCRFCENNQEPPSVYNSHSLRDGQGKLTCPRLRKYVCPICFTSGDEAHTVRYCPKKPVYLVKGGRTIEMKKGRSSIFYKKTIRV